MKCRSRVEMEAVAVGIETVVMKNLGVEGCLYI